MRPLYPSDLSDAELAVLAPHLPTPHPFGRPWKHPLRSLLDGIFYLVRTGGQWRALPVEYPPWQTVYWWFSRWRRDGTWERLNAALRERVRVAVGRDPQPSAGIIDSQSVKTSAVGGLRGFDGGKKLNGRKRHCENGRVGGGGHDSKRHWLLTRLGCPENTMRLPAAIGTHRSR